MTPCLGWEAALTREIALTFDDSPAEDSRLSTSEQRSRELIGKLEKLHIPPVLIFANACKRSDSVLRQLQLHSSAGHLIGNHTCTHPSLDQVGFVRYAADAAQGDTLLEPLLARQPGERFFRFSFLNEGEEVKVRDSMRQWLTAYHYRNGLVSVDDDDYLFSSKINQARKRGRKIDYSKVKSLFIRHVTGAVEFYDALANHRSTRARKDRCQIRVRSV
ncbi:MAG: polysaccharide deacetylase family protein [Methylotenera sp.]|nr:polysaccharide deacetylase family protein [Oligoflexia bacterium]